MKSVIFCAVMTAFVFTSVSAQRQPSPVKLFFTTNIVEVGKSAVIDLLIDCPVGSCAAADIRVQFDPEVLHIDDVVLGEFATQTGNIAYLLERQVDDEAATLTLRYITFGSYPASTGMGVLAHIKVAVLAEGNTELRFVQASIATQDGKTVFTPQTLTAIVTAQASYTARTLSVRAEASPPDQITVSAPNVADAIISEKVVGQTLLIEVNPDINSTSELMIDAPGHLSCTTWDDLDREIILRAGDVNNDGEIDIQDAAAIGIMRTNQKDAADLNRDGVVNIYDLIHVGRNYGQSSGTC